VEEWIRRRRERALESPVRREMLTLLDRQECSIRELHEQLSGDRSLREVNHHLAVLQDAELVWGEKGRYWRLGR